jgi:predicted transporter
MDVTFSSWLVIAVALVLANLPFMNESLFGFIPLPKPVKAAWTRVFELLVLYFVTGAIAYALEARIGNVFTQVKEFYMITVPLFAVLAFPGFVLRYLRKRHH